jgi:hypothetical protein
VKQTLVPATDVSSRHVPATNAGNTHANPPLSPSAVSSGGRGREFESRFPDQHFSQFRESKPDAVTATVPATQAILSDLARAKAAFQLRTIALVLGVRT